MGPKLRVISVPGFKYSNISEYSRNRHFNQCIQTRYKNDEMIKKVIRQIFQTMVNRTNRSSITSPQDSIQRQQRKMEMEMEPDPTNRLIIVHNFFPVDDDDFTFYLFMKKCIIQNKNMVIDHCIRIMGSDELKLQQMQQNQLNQLNNKERVVVMQNRFGYSFDGKQKWLPFECEKNGLMEFKLGISQISMSDKLGLNQQVQSILPDFIKKFKKVMNNKNNQYGIKNPMLYSSWIRYPELRYVLYNTKEWNKVYNYIKFEKHVSLIDPSYQTFKKISNKQRIDQSHFILIPNRGKESLMIAFHDQGNFESPWSLYIWTIDNCSLFRINSIPPEFCKFLYSSHIIPIGKFDYQQRENLFSFYITDYTGLYENGNLLLFLNFAFQEIKKLNNRGILNGFKVTKYFGMQRFKRFDFFLPVSFIKKGNDLFEIKKKIFNGNQIKDLKVLIYNPPQYFVKLRIVKDIPIYM